MLRVGYFEDSLPYVFFNTRGELVGFDVEMAQQLGKDIGVGVEFVPVSRAVLDASLEPALCDVVMSGAVVTADRALRVRFSDSYLDETLSFLVEDHPRVGFADWSLRARDGPVADRHAADALFMRAAGKRSSPTRSSCRSKDMDDMFKPHTPPIDVFVATAERGSAYAAAPVLCCRLS